MLNIPGRNDSVTGMLSVLHPLRNLDRSWADLPAHKSVQSIGTIPLIVCALETESPPLSKGNPSWCVFR